MYCTAWTSLMDRACPGIAIGVNAAVISIMTEWLSDLKMGFCTDGWWLNQEFCCWEVDTDEDGGCLAWRPWTTFTGGKWVIYVVFAVGNSSSS